MTLRAFVLAPTVIFQAEVASNPVDSAYPVDELTFDTVTTGAFGDIQVGQLVSFGTVSLPFEHGVQRIRKPATADTIYIGRTSKGYGYGEIGPTGTSVIRVWDLRAVWTKPWFADTDPSTSPPTTTHFKDGDIAYSDQTTEPPPVANTGPGTMATIDGSNIITVQFPAGGSNESFAVADGATITDYLWDVDDGTITVGTSASAVITATFPAGVRYVSLTVTDSNGKTHTAYCPVVADDPANSLFIPINGLSIRATQEGQEATVQLTHYLPLATYPDNTLVMIADGEPSSAGDRSHLKFVGWHHRDSADHSAERTGYITGASLTCLDVAGKMQAVHGFSQEISHADTPSHWGEMATANMDKLMHYLLQWHSNVLDVADWTWSGTGATYALNRRGANPGTLWDQVKSQGDEMNPTYKLTCNRLGQLAVIVDPQHQSGLTRTSTVQTSIDESEWSNVRYDHERYPRYFWLWGGAAIAANALNADGEIDTVFCVAPGTAPGIGYTEMRDEVGLTPSQAILNTTTGHRYARMNAPERPFRITLAGGNDHGIEPANMTWVQLTLAEDMPAAPRGLSLSAARGLPLELTLRWNVTRTGVVKSAELLWEREITGADAVTVIPEENTNEVETGLPDGYADFTPGDITIPESSYFIGDPQMYVAWSGADILRTDDINVASPTWEKIDTGVTGSIQDMQYVIVDSSTVGMWLMTSNGIWWCADIMATTPSWDNVLPVATVQAADAAPATGSVVCKCMAAYASEPGYLIVATGPLADNDENTNYIHSYTWHTHDYGQNWTQVDMTAFTFGSGASERGYHFASLHSIEIFRSEPGTIYLVRSVPVVSFTLDAAVFVSTDLGDTWSMRSDDIAVFSTGGSPQVFSLLHPFPAASDPSYVASGRISGAERHQLFRSTDEWTTNTKIVESATPTGYGGVSPLWRVNKISDDTEHLMAWFHHTSELEYHLLESNDRGASWSLLYDSGLGSLNIPNTGTQSGSVAGQVNGCSQHNTPNGWPGDASGDTWFIVRSSFPGSTLANIVQMTTDRFQNLSDKTGNLDTLLSSTWTPGPAGGIALPKIGVNV